MVITTTEFRQAQADVQAEDTATATQRQIDLQARIDGAAKTTVDAFPFKTVVPTNTNDRTHADQLFNIRLVEQEIVNERTTPNADVLLHQALLSVLRTRLQTELGVFDQVKIARVAARNP